MDAFDKGGRDGGRGKHGHPELSLGDESKRNAECDSGGAQRVSRECKVSRDRQDRARR